MSTITLSLPPDTETKLRQKAGTAGLSLESYLGQHLGKLAEAPPPAKTFEEIVEPVRKAFDESGMTDDDLKELAQEALREVREERRQRIKP